MYGIRDALPILQRRFDPRKFAAGHVGGVGAERKSLVDAAFLSELKEALAVPDLCSTAEVPRAICFAADRAATRLEGCRCHEHLLRGERSWAERVRAFRKASEKCVWKGRHVGYRPYLIRANRQPTVGRVHITF